MRHFPDTSVQWLTYAIVLLAATATLGGIIMPSLYRDDDLIRTAWLANDIITFLLAPLLLITLHQSKKGRRYARLLWLGLLAYIFYNYMFYLFGATFNAFFLIYVAIFICSFYALLLGLYSLDFEALQHIRFKSHYRMATVVFLFLVALPLAAVELREVANFLLKGREPEIPVLVLTLDLTFIIPNTILSAILLLRNNAWGIVLAVIMLVKSFTYGLVLIAGTILIAVLEVGKWDPLLPFYVFVCAGGLILLVPLLKAIKEPVLPQSSHKLKVSKT